METIDASGKSLQMKIRSVLKVDFS